jgi:GNAT superfamily N-acetyltransferase
MSLNGIAHENALRRPPDRPADSPAGVPAGDRRAAATVRGGMADVVLRPLHPEDVRELCALANRSLVGDDIPQVLDETELAEELAGVDAGADVRIAELDGTPSGYAYVWYVPSGERLERAHVFGHVDPPRRGHGVGRALMAWARERAAEQMRAAGNPLPKYVRVEAYDQQHGAHRLFARMGFEPVRWFEELLRPLDDLPAVAIDPAYDVVPWPVELASELCDVRNEAFADHWGSTPWSLSRFSEVTSKFGARLDLSVAAVERATGRMVGLCLNDHYPQDAERLGRVDGWISVLGTRAAHRGHGLASAMVITSLHRFAEAGFTHASIGVDSASPTGANVLYRRLGFVPEQRHTTYQLQIV